MRPFRLRSHCQVSEQGPDTKVGRVRLGGKSDIGLIWTKMWATFAHSVNVPSQWCNVYMSVFAVLMSADIGLRACSHQDSPAHSVLLVGECQEMSHIRLVWFVHSLSHTLKQIKSPERHVVTFFNFIYNSHQNLSHDTERIESVYAEILIEETQHSHEPAQCDSDKENSEEEENPNQWLVRTENGNHFLPWVRRIVRLRQSVHTTPKEPRSVEVDRAAVWMGPFSNSNPSAM